LKSRYHRSRRSRTRRGGSGQRRRSVSQTRKRGCVHSLGCDRSPFVFSTWKIPEIWASRSALSRNLDLPYLFLAESNILLGFDCALCTAKHKALALQNVSAIVIARFWPKGKRTTLICSPMRLLSGRFFLLSVVWLRRCRASIAHAASRHEPLLHVADWHACSLQDLALTGGRPSKAFNQALSICGWRIWPRLDSFSTGS
jgi:hypothetical protein